MRRLHAALRAVLDGKIDAETLKVDDDEEDEDGGHDVGHVGQVLAVEGLLERLLSGEIGASSRSLAVRPPDRGCLELVLAGEDEVEEGDEGPLELGACSQREV